MRLRYAGLRIRGQRGTEGAPESNAVSRTIPRKKDEGFDSKPLSFQPLCLSSNPRGHPSPAHSPLYHVRIVLFMLSYQASTSFTNC